MNKITVPLNLEDYIKDTRTIILDSYVTIPQPTVTKTLYSRRINYSSIYDLLTPDESFNQEPISPEAQECIDTINACVEHSTKLVFGPTEQEKLKIKKLQVLERKQQIQKGWKNYK